MENAIEFNMKTVPLSGTNLIEASAGTGKTYSVAMLALRLILEKEIPVKRILMVTFTNAAVAEMALRIRKFIQQAIVGLEGHPITEEPLQVYIDFLLMTKDRVVLKKQLEAALIALDEASIQTIHSFCQESLNLYAFETDQAFGLTLTKDIDSILDKVVRDFWRNRIAMLSPEHYSLCKDAASYKLLRDAVKKAISGQSYIPVNEDGEAYSKFCKAFDSLSKYLNDCKAHLRSEISAVKISRFSDNARSILREAIIAPLSFYNWLFDGKNQVYKQVLCKTILKDAVTLAEALEKSRIQYIHFLMHECISCTTQAYNEHLSAFNLLTYDQMIDRLSDAVDNNSELVQLMANQYDAIFIDEFQDTDAKQFNIYNKVFGINKILFYIGDPKQSIYGWRKADLNTYFQAAENPDTKRYSMSKNFRSSHNYVRALDHFFNIDNPFLSKKIEYQKVSAKKDEPGLEVSLYKNFPIKIFKAGNKKEIPDMCSALVSVLLNPDKYQLNGKKVSKRDIGILVRTKAEADKIATCLSKLNIKFNKVSDVSIFDTYEAEVLEHILETVLNISWRGVNKALLNILTGFNPEDIKQFDSDQLVDLFKSYQSIWTEKGTYTMFRKFLFDFEIYKRLTTPGLGSGLRVLSNVNQLLEALQEAEYKYELTPGGILQYLKKCRESKSTDSDDVEEDNTKLRVESEEEAVTIMTIHKAKGLEFPIVIAPFLDLRSEPISKSTFSSIRNEEGDYVFFNHKLQSNADLKEQCKVQTEEENRRLLYVALTRAAYNAFIFRVESNRSNNTTLNAFLKDRSDIDMHEKGDFPFESSMLSPNTATEEARQKVLESFDFSLIDFNWRKMSYSALALKQHSGKHLVSANPDPANAYDNFVFEMLPKGAKLGNMLHDIFEYIDFTDQAHWKQIAQSKLVKYFPQFEHDYIDHLLEMIDHVTRAEITIGSRNFNLNQISKLSRLAEMEFDIFTDSFSPAGLMDLDYPENMDVLVNAYPNLQGLVNGFIDLFFEHQGKYYILDWKSNFLGNTLEDYTEEKLFQAMNDSNYHLQYHLYTCAVVKYLKLRLGSSFDYEKYFGGVIYIFLRGARANHSTGIFTQIPDKSLIDNMLEAIISRKPDEVELLS